MLIKFSTSIRIKIQDMKGASEIFHKEYLLFNKNKCFFEINLLSLFAIIYYHLLY